MKYRVIFDTNTIRNAESVSDFLGGRSDLERFLMVSEIIIPGIVIEEIKHQKKKHLISKRDSFLSNPFHFLRNIDKQETEDFDIDSWVQELVEKEKIPYSLIELTKFDVLEEMKMLCLENTPPFDKNSDNGFKDAYIYFTVLEFLDNCRDGEIFVVTNDECLRQAFSRHARISLVKDFDEFQKYIDTYFREEYFISRLKEVVDPEIDENCIKGTLLNTDENWVLKIICNEKKYFVEVDFTSREILETSNFDFSEALNKLISSGSFAVTHSAINELESSLKFFSDEDFQNLFKACVENEQIHWIASDEDVKQFFTRAYQLKQQILPEDIKNQFEQYFIKI